MTEWRVRIGQSGPHGPNTRKEKKHQRLGEPLIGHTSDVFSVSFSPDGHGLVSVR